MEGANIAISISIDIDGVLASFDGSGKKSGAIQLVKRLWPGRVPEGYVPQDWYWKGILNKEEWNTLWREIDAIEDFWETLEPYEDNVDALDKWIQALPIELERKLNIYFVTARQDTKGKTVLAQTTKWLSNLGFYGLLQDNTSVIVVNPRLSGDFAKAKVYEGIGISMSVDDRTKNCRTASLCDVGKGHESFLLTRDWNKADDYKLRVGSLKEFLGKVEDRLRKEA